ncbi:MAG: hypothetical protein QOF24_1457 [Verrucomicrobiota bacterium]
MIEPKPFLIEINPTENLLVLHYHGRVGVAEVEQCAREMREVLEKLQPGFRLLVDLTRLEAMDVLCASTVEDIMNLCNEKGVAAVARVIPDPKRDIGLQIMSYFHYDPHVRIVTCASVDEAMSALSE